MSEDIIIPDILPPSEDGVFKSILTREESEPVLRDVISSVLKMPIAEAAVLSAELPITDMNEKRGIFDVNCKLDGNKQAAVEMQANSMKGDSIETGHPNIRGRSVLELCKLHAKQPSRGSRYADIMKSYQITFCGYTVFPGVDSFINWFSFRNGEGYELSDAVGIIIVELTKLGKIMEKPVEKMTPAEMWAIFFKYGNSAKHSDLLGKIRDKREEIEMATKILTSISRDERERARYRSRQIHEMDMAHNYAVSREEGREEGHIEERIEVAKKALSKGLSISLISTLTGLTADEIEALRQ
jgi:predicted transposase/invertase (TIGR01784 family)